MHKRIKKEYEQEKRSNAIFKVSQEEEDAGPKSNEELRVLAVHL